MTPNPRRYRPAAKPKKAPFKVSPRDVARARAEIASKPVVNAFALPVFPPGVVPNEPEIAQDEAFSGVSTWAYGQAQAGYAEGFQFFGFAFLSELAQRPEYRAIVETIATEMTRRWIRFEGRGDEDKSQKIAEIEAEFHRLRVKDVFRKGAEHDGYFGRGHAYIDFDDVDLQERQTPIGDGFDATSVGKVKPGSLKRLRSLEPIWTSPANYNTSDPLADEWYIPQTWNVQGHPVHTSRLLTFVGREVPDLLKPSYAFGGISMTQMVRPYIDKWLKTQRSVSDLISSFSVMGIKTDLTGALDAGGTSGDIFRRIEFFTALRDNANAMVLNKDEELFNVSVPLGTLDALQAQSLEHICSISRIPLVKYTGITPSGLNASSEGEIRVWYDWIHGYQEHLFRPNVTKVLGLVQLNLYGEIDPDVGFEFNHLWSMDEKEIAEVQLIRAQTGAILLEDGSLLPEEERARVAKDQGTPYHGLDLSLELNPPKVGEQDDLPSPPAPPKPSDRVEGEDRVMFGTKEKV